MIFLPYALAVLLQLTVLIFLLRGAFQKYPVLFLYCSIQFGTNILMGIVAFGSGIQTQLYRNLYWTTDLTLDLLRFFLVIALTLQIIHGSGLKPGVERAFAIIATAAILLPFVLFHPFFTSRWFRHTSQLMSFAGAAMNLLLWTVLVERRRRDPELLLVCAGLGISVTGVAITYGLLQFSGPHIRWLPDLIKSGTLLVGTLIWCYAFRPATRPLPVQAESF
jgi:hypothetical protein